jgi:hypothetical protein
VAAFDDEDLPEPPPRSFLSEEHRREHRWRTSFALFAAAVFYGAIHKVAVPFVLSQTPVLVKEYGQIDFWAFPGIVLVFWLYKNANWVCVGQHLRVC